MSDKAASALPPPGLHPDTYRLALKRFVDRRAYGETATFTIQPMSVPVGSVFYLDYVYGANKTTCLSCFSCFKCECAENTVETALLSVI